MMDRMKKYSYDSLTAKPSKEEQLKIPGYIYYYNLSSIDGIALFVVDDSMSVFMLNIYVSSVTSCSGL